MAYMDINGHSTWVEDQGGSGEPLLLLHGGMSNGDLLLSTIGSGLADFRLVAFDRRGHGYTADSDADFHYADMATETIRVLESVVGGRAHLVGWSDGGIVGLLVALERPDLVHKLVVIGTNYHYDALLPIEVDLQSPFIQTINSAYIERSPDGPDHLEAVFGKSLAMFSAEPTLTTNDLAGISHPTLVVAGDDDLVSLSHTCSLYEAIPRAQLAVVPGASHALPMEQPARLAALIHDFLTASAEPETLLPVRRALHSDT